jgi:Carboxypeptidase regulatory-like domain
LSKIRWRYLAFCYVAICYPAGRNFGIRAASATLAQFRGYNSAGMRCLRILAFALIAVLPTLAQSVYPGLATSNDNQRYALSGTVINSVTGEPIRRALVTVFVQQQSSMMTDSSGRFELEGLPQGKVMVTAQKPGFFTDQELSGGRSRPPQFAVGPDAQQAIIRLVPEAIITGRIVDTDGLPVRGLNVRSLTQKLMNGRKEWQQGTFARTDEDGVYRISNLQPGAYFLIAGPGRALAFVSGAEDTSELGYPAVVYPNETSPMRINAGQQVEANFTVKPEQFYSISGSVTGITPGGHYSVQLIPRMPGMRVPLFGASPDVESGAFTIPRVAPGDYVLQAHGQDPIHNQAVFGSVQISVHRSLMGVTIGLESTLTIPIHVRTERTKEATGITNRRMPEVQLRLMPVDEQGPAAFSSFEDPRDPNSPLVLKNARPDRYRLELQPSFGDTYVASARFGNTDLLAGEVTISNSANQGAIEVVIRDDAARLGVKLRSDEEMPVTVLVVPDRGDPRLNEMMATPNGTEMQVGGLRPGTYTVLAFEDIGSLEYMNRAALEPYLSHGAKISLGANQQSTVTPDIIKRGAE